MTTQQVADRLVALCRQGEIMKAMDELYAEPWHFRAFAVKIINRKGVNAPSRMNILLR